MGIQKNAQGRIFDFCLHFPDFGRFIQLLRNNSPKLRNNGQNLGNRGKNPKSGLERFFAFPNPITMPNIKEIAITGEALIRFVYILRKLCLKLKFSGETLIFLKLWTEISPEQKNIF